VFSKSTDAENAWHLATAFGLRWQSEAATALLTEQPQPSSCFQSGVALRLPPQSKIFSPAILLLF
jgi:hypothetical protein